MRRAAEARVRCRALMRSERRDLRHFLQGLRPEQLQEPSLCAGWSVRDVAAHLQAWDELLLYRSQGEHLQALVRFITLYIISVGSMTRLNQRLHTKTSRLTSEELVRLFGAKDTAELKWLFDGTNPGAHLAEYVIHHEDMRRTLRSPREASADVLVAALNGLTKLPGVRWSAWRQLRRRRWKASDLDWSLGRGDLVALPAQEILMALAGRPAAPLQDA